VSTGTALADVDISVYDSFGVFVGGGRTGSDGRYLVQGLPGRDFFARAFSATHVSQLYSGIECVFCDVTTGTVISVPLGATSSDAGTGAGLANVFVSLNLLDGSFGAGATTDVFGNYTIAGIPPGTYFVRTFNSLGYVDRLYPNLPADCCGMSIGSPLLVASGGTINGINFALSLGGRLSGQVIDSVTRTPVA